VGSAQQKLEIEITNLKNDKGFVLVELLDENQKSIHGSKGLIKDKKSLISIENLKQGKYAIRYFHDQNVNDKLDTNWFGIPSEGYGFSNDAYGAFGPKPFKDWLFELNDRTKIVLKTKN
jgi:uncharacterized protein (DUF2141 family)